MSCHILNVYIHFLLSLPLDLNPYNFLSEQQIFQLLQLLLARSISFFPFTLRTSLYTTVLCPIHMRGCVWTSFNKLALELACFTYLLFFPSHNAHTHPADYWRSLCSKVSTVSVCCCIISSRNLELTHTHTYTQRHTDTYTHT